MGNMKTLCQRKIDLLRAALSILILLGKTEKLPHISMPILNFTTMLITELTPRPAYFGELKK